MVQKIAYPGVYVQEGPSGIKTIQSLPASIAGVVGSFSQHDLANQELEGIYANIRRPACFEFGRIRLNASIVKASHIINPGDWITLDTSQAEPLTGHSLGMI